MSKISIYDVVPVPKLADKLVGTSVGGDPEDLTYNFTLGELLNLFIPNIPGNTLQGVLDFGNTATQNINLTGTVNTTNLTVSATANILNSNLTGQTKITGGLFDRLNSIGTAGQVLTSTGTQVEWYTIPTIIPNLQQVLTAGNTAVNNIILTGNLSANNAALLTATISTSLTLLGTLKDGLSSVGAINQVLSSIGTGVRWVNLPVYSAASPLLYNSGTGVFSIQQANASQSGFLSSADWITFDGKQTAISLTTTGSSGPSTLVGATINVPNYTLSGLGGVPQTRTLTINGVTYNLSADRSWTIAAGVSSVTASSPLFSTGGATPNITIQQSSSSLDGYLSSVDWLTFNSKQAFLGGTGLVKSVAGTISYITDNSANWNTAYNDSIVSAAVTGTATKLLTLNQQDGGTITASWSDIDTGLTSVGVSMPTAFTVTNSPLTSNGTIAITGSGNTLQYIDGTGALQTFPSLTGFVPYTGATGNVNLGAYTLTATSLIKNGGTSGQFLKADGSVDSSAYIVLGSLSASAPLSYNNLTGAFSIIQSGTVTDGYLSSTDWNTFNLKQGALTLTTTGTSGASTLIGNTLNIPTYTDQFVGTVTSVGLSMPSAFTVSNSPVTSSGTLTVVGAGLASQYVRGDGSLGDFPGSGGGGGSSVSYYLNGSVSQGTIGGVAYRELSKVPILGAGTDISINADGYIASFITDAGDPALLEIPAGNWNFETFFSASSGGGSPTFYVELYKVNGGGTATLIASNSATPEFISFGTNIEPYFSSLAVPQTALVVTDRLAVRYYVIHDGRTITLHTENGHLCQIITTFTTGLTALNGLTEQVQYFSTGTTGTDFNISSAVATHTFNLPTASATDRGALSSADWTTFNNKQPAGNYVTLDTTQTITALKTILRGGDVLDFKIGVDTLYGLKIAYNQNELVPSGEATWSFVNTFNRNSVGFSVTPLSFFRGVLVTGERLLSASVNTNLLDYYTNNPSGRYPIYAYNTGVQQFQDSILVGFNTGVVNTVTGAIASLPAGVVANFNGRVIGSNAVNSNEFATLGQLTGGTVTSVGLTSVTSGVTIGSTPITTSGNITIAIATATGSQNGLLSSTDWTTFNSKQGAITLTTTGTSGASTLVGNTLNIPNYTDAFVGTVTSVSFSLGSTGTDLSSSVANSTTTPAITLNVPTASASARGALSAANWTTFNNKQDAITLTTTGTSGAATLVGATLNIPNYGSALSGYLPLTGGTLTGPLGGTSATFSSSVTANDLIQVSSGTIADLRARGGGYVTNYNTSLRSILGAIGVLQLGNNSDNYILAGNTAAGGYLSIRVNVSAESIISGTEALRIFSNSNVFIGNSPSDNGARLQVSGTSTFSDTVTLNGSNNVIRSGNELRFNRTDNLIYTRLYDAGSTFALDNRNGNGFSFQSAGTNQFVIASTGAATFTTTTTLGITIVTNDVTTLKMNSTGGTKNWGFATTNLAASDFGIYQSNLGGGDAINAGAARMYFTGGGNVLIGTTTDPGRKLNVNGVTRSTAFDVFYSSVLSGFLLSEGQWVGNASSNLALAAETGYAMTFFTNGSATEKMRLSTGGNLGIGTTSPNKKLEVTTGNGTTNGIRLTYAGGVTTEGMDITYLNTGQTTTSFDSLYNSDSAVMQFRMKTAGTAVTAMTILGSGNVGIGTASPDTYSYGGTRKFLTFRATATNEEPFLQLIANGTGNSIIDFGNATIRRATIIGLDGSSLGFYTNGTNSGTAMSERMRITSGGIVEVTGTNLTIATNGGTGTLNLDQSGVRRWKLSSGFITSGVFSIINGSTDTAVLNISGSNNVLIGTTSDSGYKLDVVGGAQIIKSGTSSALEVGLSGVTGSLIRFKYNGGFVGSISTDGSNTAYNTSSDYRLKEQVRPIDNPLEKVLKLNPVNFKYKNSKTLQDGFIAHEIQEILPYLVTGEKDGAEMQEVDYSKLTPILIAAIKELKQEIDKLRK
jgi:hypothetical protein